MSVRPSFDTACPSPHSPAAFGETILAIVDISGLPMATRHTLPALQPSDFTSAFPNSRKVHVEAGDLRVPMQEIALGGGLRFASTTRADRKATTSATVSPGSGSRGSSHGVTSLQKTGR